MKILFTNNTLKDRAGSELYVRDLASALAREGHEVAAYSNIVGDVAEEISCFGIPVVADVADVPFTPDIIHGHHHLELMTALLQFPGVPAVNFCHGFVPWQELPLAHPRIMEYVAVDEPSYSRCIELGIPAESLRLMLNFVDTDRFRPRGPLPASPKRALVFSNQASEDNYLAVVRAACDSAGLELDARGVGCGMPEKWPEQILGRYDIVFCKARCALEALAVGTAVILCDVDGVGPMVTSDGMDALRLRNFGRTTLVVPPSPEVLLERIRSYDADDAARVSARICREASLKKALPAIMGMYRTAVEKMSEKAPDPVCESLAGARYIRMISEMIKVHGMVMPYDHNAHKPRMRLDWSGKPAAGEGARQDPIPRKKITHRIMDFLKKMI
ncbi:MAG: hypothetical protein ABFD97_03525 [Syntrophobacter sp.]